MTNIARQFQSADEMRQNAAAVRNRLMNPVNAFRPVKPSPVLRIVQRVVVPPMWRQEDMQFDEHIRAWQWYLASNRCSKIRAYIIRRCAELGADYMQVIGPSHAREITGPRQIIMWELRTKLNVSYPRIGREFGGRDHTTVIHAVARVAKIMGEDRPEYQSGTQRLLNDPDLKAKVKEAHQSGDTLEEISIAFGVSERAITAVGKSENWYRGSQKTHTSFQAVTVNISALRKDYETWPENLKKLGEKYGISDSTIARLAKRHGWTRRKHG
jgi:hypothetical protein